MAVSVRLSLPATLEIFHKESGRGGGPRSEAWGLALRPRLPNAQGALRRALPSGVAVGREPQTPDLLSSQAGKLADCPSSQVAQLQALPLTEWPSSQVAQLQALPLTEWPSSQIAQLQALQLKDCLSFQGPQLAECPSPGRKLALPFGSPNCPAPTLPRSHTRGPPSSHAPTLADLPAPTLRAPL
jgi:hypothetical protein